MKRYIPIFLIVLFLLTSCQNTVVDGNYAKRKTSDGIITFALSSNSGIDSITYDNYIESVRYIPLQNPDGKYLRAAGRGIYVRKINDKFCVSSIEDLNGTSVLYDDKGNYLNELYTRGRGPKELLAPSCFISNEVTGKVYFIDPTDKILEYDVNERSSKAYRISMEDIMYTEMYQWCSFDDGSFASVSDFAFDIQYNDNKIPYMFGYDKKLKLTSKIYYPRKKKVFQNLKDVGTPYEGWHLKRTSEGVEFIDVYNDTIYSLGSDLSIKPIYVFPRNEKNRPEYSDNRGDSRKIGKIYFYDFMDSERFFFLTYTLDKVRHTAIWDKKNGDMIMNKEMNSFNIFRFCSAPFSFDGINLWLPIEYVTSDNKIYVVVESGFVEKKIPGISKEVDNVLIEISLKN